MPVSVLDNSCSVLAWMGKVKGRGDSFVLIQLRLINDIYLLSSTNRCDAMVSQFSACLNSPSLHYRVLQIPQLDSGFPEVQRTKE